MTKTVNKNDKDNVNYADIDLGQCGSGPVQTQTQVHNIKNYRTESGGNCNEEDGVVEEFQTKQ